MTLSIMSLVLNHFQQNDIDIKISRQQKETCNKSLKFNNQSLWNTEATANQCQVSVVQFSVYWGIAIQHSIPCSSVCAWAGNLIAHHPELGTFQRRKKRQNGLDPKGFVVRYLSHFWLAQVILEKSLHFFQTWLSFPPLKARKQGWIVLM